MTTILLVDDNPTLIDMMRRGLELLGYQVETASDGAEGLEQCVRIHPACVVIDVKMPELNGYQLVRALRGDPETTTIPLVILSAMAQDEDKYEGLAAGVDFYLTKPVTPNELHHAIEAAISTTPQQRAELIRALIEETGGLL